MAGQSQSSLRWELGGQVQGELPLGTTRVQVFVRAAWANYALRKTVINIKAGVLPNAAFTVRGARPDAAAALLSAGLEVPVLPGLALGARAESEFSGNVTQVAGTMRLRYRF